MSADISAKCLYSSRTHAPLYSRISNITLRDHVGGEREGGKKREFTSFAAVSCAENHIQNRRIFYYWCINGFDLRYFCNFGNLTKIAAAELKTGDGNSSGGIIFSK